MIITENKPFGLIKSILEEKGFKKIAVLSCNACAKICETGGEKQLKELVNKLRENGFSVVYEKLVPILCDIDMIKKEVSSEINNADAILLLGCVAGTFAIRKVFSDKEVIEAVDTIGIGARDEKGDIYLVRRVEG